MFTSTLRTRKTTRSATAITLRDVRKVHGRGDGPRLAIEAIGVRE